MARSWNADPTASFARRLCRPPHEGGESDTYDHCPDIWELDNGDIAVVGRDLTSSFAERLPDDVSIDDDERLVVIPRETIISAKVNIPDA
jgi:hypothetical protein